MKTEQALVEQFIPYIRRIWGDRAEFKSEVSCHDRARVDLCIRTSDQLIGVEAKLHDWQQAVVQAYLHASCFDESYIVLPAAKVRQHVVAEAGSLRYRSLKDGRGFL